MQEELNIFVRFECEIENYSSMEHVLAKLDMKTVKLSGFQVREGHFSSSFINVVSLKFLWFPASLWGVSTLNLLFGIFLGLPRSPLVDPAPTAPKRLLAQ